jgi:adenylate cyclase
MAVEIERKFLVRGDPTERLSNHEGQHLRQGYLALDQAVEVRVRISPQSAVVTIKAGRGITRTEVEMTVGASQAEELWTHTVGRRIEKTRYRIDLRPDRDARGACVAEVDVYHGDLTGLFLAEWFGREVSDDERWSNASLARNGTPKEFTDELP